MRFDDDEYLKNFYEFGKYPKIHDDIFFLAGFIPKSYNVIDLGCCTGLLSHRLATRHHFVIGIESSAKYLQKAVQKENVQYKNLYINESTLSELKQVIINGNIKAVYARRVIPEIYETGGFELVNDFIATLYDSGVEYVILEGRKSNRNAVNPLHSIAEEGKIFGRWYQCIKEYNNCQILKRK